MDLFIVILSSTFLVSLISFVGLLGLYLKKDFLQRTLDILVSFAAGTLLGAVFFDLLPEISEGIGTFVYCILGIIIFLFVEKYIHWHHCHKGDCKIKPLAHLNLLGDGIHNLIDGMIIAASYLQSFHLGLVTTLAVIFHEIPQEIGDFAILIKSGLKPKKALILNFLSALVAMIGSIIVFILFTPNEKIISIFLSIAAGGFIYLSLVDIVPEIHKEVDLKKGILQGLSLIIGIIIMFIITSVLH